MVICFVKIRLANFGGDKASKLERLAMYRGEEV
jgi:hypothetical protein